MYKIYATWISLVIIVLSNSSIFAQEDPHPGLPKQIIVGTTDSAPFAFQNALGEWSGLSIELWRGVAEKLGLDYRFKKYSLKNLLIAVEKGEIDIAVADLSINPKRDQVMEFTHTYFGTGLGIATKFKHDEYIWMRAIEKVFTSNFINVVISLAVVLFIVGVFVWLIERKSNPQQFGGPMHRGLGNGFWWSAVTMTTVGYGDKAPLSFLGRSIGLIWMFTSIIIISGFTGAISSSLTVVNLSPLIQGPQDLAQINVAVIADTEGQDFLENAGVHPTEYATLLAAMDALLAEDVQAVVSDYPILSYWVSRHDPFRITVLDKQFDPEFLSFALPEKSKLLKPVNIAILEYLETPAWNSILKKYNVN